MKSLILLEQLNKLLQRLEEQQTSYVIKLIMNGAHKSHNLVNEI